MKVSVNWLKDINQSWACSANLIPADIDALVDLIGTKLGAVDEVIDLSKKYQDIVVVMVKECAKHPNADKLSVCLVDDGRRVKAVKRNMDGLVQVVCGAPNVKAGMLAAWIPPGAKVPSTFEKEPFVIEAREIRGQMSNGMLASGKELALNDDHEGIVELKGKGLKPGDNFAAAYGLDDVVIDIENKMFTHRPDLFGMLGVAREVAGIQSLAFRSPKWYAGNKTLERHETDNKLLIVKNGEPKLVPRLMARVVKNVKVEHSGLELQSLLSRVGIRPINNIVDVTNYIMHLTAQPIHAYDYDKLKSLSGGTAYLSTRMAKAGENLTLLGGKKVTLSGGEIVIATDKQAVGLAGVMGGADTEVDANTKNIVIECATFDMNVIRRTAMAHGLFTDAATRFTKGQSPLQNDKVLALAVEKILSEAGGLAARSIYDLHKDLWQASDINISADFINSRLGLDLPAKQIAKNLENVEFEVKEVGDKLKIKVPYWRTDIDIPEDIVEEVGRLYGYDKLPQQLPEKDLEAAAKDSWLKLKDKLRDVLRTAGANEVLTYSFVHGRLLEKSGQDPAKSYHIKNAVSPDLQYYRQSLSPSLLEKVHPNIKNGYDTFCLYEIGRSHVKGVLDEEKLPAELLRLSLVWSSNQPLTGAAYFQAKEYAEYVLAKLGIFDLKFTPLPDAATLPDDWRAAAAPFAEERAAAIYCGDKLIGLVGEPAITIREALKLPKATSMAELDLSMLLSFRQAVQYTPLNRFPSLDQDICLRVPSPTAYGEVLNCLRSVLEEQQVKHGYNSQILPIDIYQQDKGNKHKQITWRITVSHPERTLVTQEVSSLLDDIATRAKSRFGAVRV